MSVVQDYSYLTGSTCAVVPDGGRLDLASSGGTEAHPWLFSGALAAPAAQAQALLVVARCARTRFHQRFDPLLADPVVTAHSGTVRFESLSSCASVYLRHDTPVAEAQELHPGVTNVDVGTDTRNVLAQVRSGSTLSLNVGTDLVAITTDTGFAVERKVKLPTRWVKGFAEVALAQRRLERRFDLAGPLAIRFLRSLPRSGRDLYAVPTAREPRWSSQPAAGSVPVNDPQRLQLLSALVPFATHLTVHADDHGTSLWQLDSPAGRTHLALTPQASRGFSGEGGTLAALASDYLLPVVDDVAQELTWQERLDPAELGRRTGLATGEVADSLDVLAATGRAGYDVDAGSYFHRDLPFDLARVPALQPRLRSAQALAEAGAVSSRPGAVPGELWVRGEDSEHRVRLEADPPVCTCTWWARHRGRRGPCKHVLAAQIVTGRLG